VSLAENKLLVRRYYEEVVSTGDTSSITSFLSPQYTEVHEGKRYAIGIDGAIAHLAGVRATYRDLLVVVEQQIAEGEWVASTVRVTGVHEGEWIGIRPTGLPVAFTGVNLDRVVDGRIVEHGGAANLLGPLLEIGAVRVVGGA